MQKARITLLAAITWVAGCGLNTSSLANPDGGVQGGGGVGDACDSSRPCRTGLDCNEAKVCAATGMGVMGTTCAITEECGADLYCGPSRTCETAGTAKAGDSCMSTATCSHGLVCTIAGLSATCTQAGQTDLGKVCTTATDCLAGLSCAPLPSGTNQCVSPPATTSGAPLPLIPVWSGIACEKDDGTPQAYFSVPKNDGTDKDYFRLPFPNDIRTANGHPDFRGYPSPGTALPIDIIDRYAQTATRDLDGFGTNPVVYFRFSKPYDWSTVSGKIRLIELGSTYRDVGITWVTTSGRLSKYICEDWLAVRTPHGEPLKPGTTYAAVLLSGIKVNGGEAFQRAENLTSLLQASAPQGASDAMAKAYEKYAPLRRWLTDSKTDASQILNAAVFTTQTPNTVASRLRAAIRSQAAPPVSGALTLCDSGVTSPCDDGTEQRKCSARSNDFIEIHGKIALPVYQDGTEPYETPEAGGRITEMPSKVRTENVCIAITVPRATKPAGGWPVVLYGHGTGGSFTTTVRSGLAQQLATGTVGDGTVSAAKVATVAIDLPSHGSRRGSSTRKPEELFFNFLNPNSARDNQLQGAADLLSLVYWAEKFDGSGTPTGTNAPTEAVTFDPSKIALFGHSQGANHAALMLPFERLVLAAVLSGLGGDLTQSLLNKSSPAPSISAVLPYALLDIDSAGKVAGGDFNPALSLFQHYFERVDTVNFAGLLQTPSTDKPAGSHVFITYGLGDTYAPEPTLQAYAIAGGFTFVTPIRRMFDGIAGTQAPPLSENVTFGATKRTIGEAQYDKPADDDGHFVAINSGLPGQVDVRRFLLQALSGVAPQIKKN